MHMRPSVFQLSFQPVCCWFWCHIITCCKDKGIEWRLLNVNHSFVYTVFFKHFLPEIWYFWRLTNIYSETIILCLVARWHCIFPLLIRVIKNRRQQPPACFGLFAFLKPFVIFSWAMWHFGQSGHDNPDCHLSFLATATYQLESILKANFNVCHPFTPRLKLHILDTVSTVE